ncbi:MAG: nucleoside-diphosphate sugar epimerase/dehydratase [Pseudomonadota bacterium]|nr:nucleoside-diphosphate sugar epimerase/dehydratase [Pseudomonadota bacterium]
MNSRVSLTLGHDLVMAALSFYIALYLRLGPGLFDLSQQIVGLGLIAFIACAAVVFVVFGLPRMVWRYCAMDDMMRIGQAVIVTLLLFVAVQFVITRLDDFPRSFLIIDLFVLTALLALPRLAFRAIKDGRLSHLWERGGGNRVLVLLIGAGNGSALFLRELAQGSDAPYRVVGIIDDQGEHTGQRIQGVDVLGDWDQVETVLDRLAARGTPPQRLVMTRAEPNPDKLRQLVDLAQARGIELSRMPRLPALQKAEGGAAPTLRPVEIGDLLGRPENVLDRAAVSTLISGKRILVTGAGGSIGGELVRQIARLGPAHLSLFDVSEYALYEIDLEVGEAFPDLPRTAIIGDIRDRTRVMTAVADSGADLIFHAAALKHVPLMEANVDEAVLTNVIGTRNLADAARAAGVAGMVLISTDKAVNPTNVMGATKRLAEAYCQASATDTAGTGPRFTIVRFGNVLGSTGSVIPLFQRQLARGGPLTVTDPAMTRYFMTVGEAVELVLQAAVLDDSRIDSGAICVLDMGQPVRILDLAEQMIRLSGARPGRDVKIVFTGLRAGEKLHEELFHAGEQVHRTRLSAIHLATPRAADLAMLGRQCDGLGAAAEARETTRTLALLGQAVPEFAPQRADAATAATDNLAERAT